MHIVTPSLTHSFIQIMKVRLIFTLIPQGAAQYFCGISICISTVMLMFYFTINVT